jgi:hypothetical protein
MTKRDYYDVLGVARHASDTDIKIAFRAAAKEHHPDIIGGQGGDVPAAERRTKEITEAFSILKDPQQRAAYDRYGHTDNTARPDAASPYPYTSDVYEDLFGQFTSRPSSGGFRQNASSTTSKCFPKPAQATEQSVLDALKATRYPQHHAADLTAIYTQRPELIAGTASTALRGMNGQTNDRHVAELVSAIAAQVKLRKATLSSAALDGITDTSILKTMAAVGGLVQDSHILHAQASTLYPQHNAADLTAIYTQRPELIAGTASTALRGMNGQMSDRHVAILVDMIVNAVNAGRATLRADVLNGIKDNAIIAKLKTCALTPDTAPPASSQKKATNG